MSIVCRFSGDGITDCGEHGLYSNYVSRIGEPNGELETNLVRICDNYAVPDYDFRACDHNTYMCCWTENDVNGVLDNTVRHLTCAVVSALSSDFLERHRLIFFS